MGWFAVRCVFRGTKELTLYEERVTLWRADSFEDAIERAEAEADEYTGSRSVTSGSPRRTSSPTSPATGRRSSRCTRV
jgi:hypothetical protein